jgi:hypothetical protein
MTSRHAVLVSANRAHPRANRILDAPPDRRYSFLQYILSRRRARTLRRLRSLRSLRDRVTQRELNAEHTATDSFFGDR